MPVTTAACIEGTSRKASDKNKGNPTTVPRALMAKGRQWRRAGQGARTASRYKTLKRPASAARPAVTKAGGNCGAWVSPTARRVMGKVMAKITTPSRPRAKPRATRAGAGPAGVPEATERGEGIAPV